MDMDWTEKYRPTTLDQVYGNQKAITTLLKWAKSWDRGIPDKKAVILAGSPGIGKTSAALALARDMDWGVIELNASDVRNAENIRHIATRGALFETFTDTGKFIRARDGGRKVIILDEADNLYERVSTVYSMDRSGKDYSDRGGRSAIIETIKLTMQPIILIVNDLYALTKNTNLKKLCETIRFQKIRAPSIEKALIVIIHNEGLEVEREVLEIIASRANGDLRAAINDLQALSRKGKRITVDMTEGMGFRDNVITLQEALSSVFKGIDVDVRKVAWDLDETPDSFLSWIDENLPRAYTDPMDLMKGYDALSRADIFLGRVRRRQYYRLWAYANDMMTAGVALAKNRIYHHYTRYQFPGWILKMSRTKGMRRSRNELAKKIGQMCHTSMKDARMELLPVVQVLFRQSEKMDFDFAINMTDRLDLTYAEVSFLLGTPEDDPRVAHIREKAIEHHGERTGFFPSQMGTKKATTAGFEIKKKKKSRKKEKKTKKPDRKEGEGREDESTGEKGNSAGAGDAPGGKGEAGEGEGETGKAERKKESEHGEDEGEGTPGKVENEDPGAGPGGKGKEETGTGKEGTGEAGKSRKKETPGKPEPRPEKPWF